jgi:uncharacterized damage-inducible protein DinB
MNLKELLLKQLVYSYETEDWYPPLKVALEGLTAEQANWKPEGVAVNSIWETANHILYYKERLVAQLQGEAYSNIDNDKTFDTQTNETDWQKLLARFNDNQQKLENLLNSYKEEDFNRQFKGYSFAKMISSINMHDAYHTGQIIQIRKLQGSWVAKRAF